MADENDLRWSRSSMCESSACIEIAQSGDFVLMRNSRRPDGVVLRIAKARWAAFVTRLGNELAAPAL